MKSHLVVSSEPLREGEDQVALCGVIVPKVQFGFQFIADHPAAGEIMACLSTISTCAKCLQVADNGKYWYGAVPGQEFRDNEAA
jgi:hypothetical protein